ncbi:nickel-dependent hydrogenase large subunit [Novispirillum sp. DQ9]|uniref:nickel-dependent hydrogenase large subunit n=1 Tax=Novispirillum sp. DQ9 TaxID=3398612 RepID=UPI003C7B529A
MSRLVMGPFNRVEGDLEVHLDIADGVVRDARVSAPLYRGFERILQGRAPLDALAIAPRICGICSVSQSMAAARALETLAGVEVPPNGRLAADLVLACESVADHLTHFHLFFMPDLARATYAGRPWHGHAAERFTAIKGAAAAEFLKARAEFLHLMGILAGKWPHSLALQPGGTTKPVDMGEQVRLLSILAGFRAFVETRLIGDRLERFTALDSAEALAAWATEAPPESSDLRFFLNVADDLGFARLGRGQGRFLSHGGIFGGGVWDGGGAVSPLRPDAIAEHLAHAWMSGPDMPDADKPDAYSWCKAPRLDGAVMEVGALARQVIGGHPLARALAATEGATVRSRVLGRLLETARLLPMMEAWVRALRPREPFCATARLPDSGAAAGLVEAARGALGHWMTVEHGRIRSYQIIAPTTWNFSPRDDAGVPGAVEQALVGTPAEDGTPVAVQHVIRSFDPCMACTVH